MHASLRMRALHRRIAVGAIAIIAWFAISGIALNHSTDFSLQKRQLPRALADMFYGVSLPATLSGVRVADTSFVIVDGTLHQVRETVRAIAACNSLRGALALDGLQDGLQIVACDDAVYLLDTDGNRVDRIDAAWGLRGTISGIGAGSGNQRDTLVIASTDGNWCSDKALAAIAPCSFDPAALPVMTPSPIDAATRRKLAAGLATPDVDVERFVHDLHSGALFGSKARFAWDLFALALLALAGTGLSMLRRKS